MREIDDRNDPHNPFRRPPAWRWARACHLVENNKRPARGRDDDRVREAVRFYRSWLRCEGKSAYDKLARKMPAPYQAWQLHQDSSLARSVLEARLLTNEATREVARKCAFTEDVVEAYSDLYYDVRNRLHARDWLITLAIGRGTHSGLTGAGLDVLVKLYAFHGGPLVLDAVVAYFKDPVIVVPPLDGLKAAGLTDLHRRLSIRASVLARTLPTDPANCRGVMMLQARFGVNSAQTFPVSLACADQLVSEKDLSALLVALPAEPDPLFDQRSAGQNGAAA